MRKMPKKTSNNVNDLEAGMAQIGKSRDRVWYRIGVDTVSILCSSSSRSESNPQLFLPDRERALLQVLIRKP